jgi:hypothetical protein
MEGEKFQVSHRGPPAKTAVDLIKKETDKRRTSNIERPTSNPGTNHLSALDGAFI